MDQEFDSRDGGPPPEDPGAAPGTGDPGGKLPSPPPPPGGEAPASGGRAQEAASGRASAGDVGGEGEQDLSGEAADQPASEDLESAAAAELSEGAAGSFEGALEAVPPPAEAEAAEAAQGAESQAGPGADAAAPPEAQAPPAKLAPCKEAVEALLFAAENPLNPNQLAGYLGKTVKPAQVKEWVEQLASEYDQTGRSFQIEEIAGGWRLMTRPEYGPYVRSLRITEKSSRLSEAALDTLAVVAYKQPIIKADINQIRGVESGPILKTLLEKNLVKAVGRSEVPGRPILYGTSRKFLDHFGLKSLKDLPKPEK